MSHKGYVSIKDWPESTLETGDAQYAVLLDDIDPVYYVGTAAAGSSTASPVWRVKKIDTTAGVIITWADGDTNFDNIWTARAGLSYS